MSDTQQESKIDLVKRFLRSYDWPAKGIVFRDISPLLKEPAALAAVTDLFEDYVKRHHREVELIAGVDARGFVFGAVLAQRLGKGFLMLRKKGKLPGPTMSVSYTLEYGQAELEVQADAVDRPGQKVLIIDDILATGGTMAAACELMAKQQAEVLACLFVVELRDLDGAKKVPHTVYSLIQYGGLL